MKLLLKDLIMLIAYHQSVMMTTECDLQENDGDDLGGEGWSAEVCSSIVTSAPTRKLGFLAAVKYHRARIDQLDRELGERFGQCWPEVEVDWDAVGFFVDEKVNVGGEPLARWGTVEEAELCTCNISELMGAGCKCGGK